MAFKKILVALDRSDQSQAVFEQALELAKKEKGSLMLFHCLSWEKEGQMGPFIGIGTLADIGMYETVKQLRHESLQRDIEQVKNWLQTYSDQAMAEDIPIELDCKVGNSGSWICDLATNWQAELVVVGRRGREGLTEVLLGSVSNYVLHHAPCSVLVVQGAKLPQVELSKTASQQNLSS